MQADSGPTGTTDASISSETVPVTETLSAAEAIPVTAYDWFFLAFSLSILLVFVLSITKWISLLKGGVRLFGERAIVPVRRRARPYWNPLYFLFFFAVLLVVNLQLNQWASQSVVAGEAAKPSAGDATISVTQLLLSSVSMVIATLATMWLARTFRPQVLPESDEEHERPVVGWLPRQGDISLGLSAAFLILPPTMLMMAAVSAMQEYSHPVLDAIKPGGPDSQADFGIFATLFFTTAIVTPLVEEFWFRGMLQGGLQRIADAIVDMRRWSNAAVAGETQAPEMETWDQTEPEKTAVVHRNSATRNDWTPTAIWPIVVTSVIFAIMHWGQGLAPIPLFFLSLGLGYLYRQTGSLIPSIVVHFVLNGFTMTATLLELLRGSS